MHDYSIDKHPKEKILFALAFLAILSAPLISKFLTSGIEELGLTLGGWKAPVVAIPTFSLFGLLYLLFDKRLWKVARLRKFLLVPDLNGTWTCTGKTVLKEGAAVDFDWSAKITITQSWSKMLIHLQTAQSSSKSIAASLNHIEGVGYSLFYQFANTPKAGEPDLRNHSGAAELLFSEDGARAEGHYYTDQHRSTVGKMKLTKD